jgi:hypothetical protein
LRITCHGEINEFAILFLQKKKTDKNCQHLPFLNGENFSGILFLFFEKARRNFKGTQELFSLMKNLTIFFHFEIYIHKKILFTN